MNKIVFSFKTGLTTILCFCINIAILSFLVFSGNTQTYSKMKGSERFGHVDSISLFQEIASGDIVDLSTEGATLALIATKQQKLRVLQRSLRGV